MEQNLCECERHRYSVKHGDRSVPCTCKAVADCYVDQCLDAPF